MSGNLDVWTRCEQCQHVEGWVVPDDILLPVFPPCEVCGCDRIVLADYHPERKDAA